jgi:hypothetical protein
MRVFRAVVLMPKNNSFYNNLSRSICRAFEGEGVSVRGHCGPLAERDYVEMMALFNPDIVFEMNRVRSEVPWLDHRIKHISWVVDLEGRDESQLMGSDITYFFDPSWVHYDPGGHKDWLPPGGTVRDAGSRLSKNVDVVFFGHIPQPWSELDLERKLGQTQEKQYTFGDLLDEFYKELKKNYEEHRSLAVDSPLKAKSLALAILKKRTGVGQLDRVIEYDLLQRNKRLLARLELMNIILRSGLQNLEIYGSENWNCWQEFRPFYRGYLHSIAEVQQVITSSRFCLHEGLGMHFRAMDCLGAGGNLLFYAPRSDNTRKIRQVWGLHTWFSAGEDYVEVWSENEIQEIQERVTHDREFLDEMGKKAQHKVRVMHTWRHRVQKIIRDIERYL